jgi:hypothetical protein
LIHKIKGYWHLSNQFVDMSYGKRANGFYHIIVHGTTINVMRADLVDSDKIKEFITAIQEAERLINDTGAGNPAG